LPRVLFFRSVPTSYYTSNDRRRPPHYFYFYFITIVICHMIWLLPAQKVSPRANHTNSFPFSSILIGEIDEERDHAIDHSTIRADPIAPIRY
jgi:hypothetical protein